MVVLLDLGGRMEVTGTQVRLHQTASTLVPHMASHEVVLVSTLVVCTTCSSCRSRLLETLGGGRRRLQGIHLTVLEVLLLMLVEAMVLLVVATTVLLSRVLGHLVGVAGLQHLVRVLEPNIVLTITLLKLLPRLLRITVIINIMILLQRLLLLLVLLGDAWLPLEIVSTLLSLVLLLLVVVHRK